MSDGIDRRRLVELARLHDVQPAYVDASGRRVRTPPDALLGALRALGVPVDGPGNVADAVRDRRRRLEERVVEPVVVAWDGRLRDVRVRAAGKARVDVAVQDGARARLAVEAARAPDGAVHASLAERLPTGYHTLSVETRGGRTTATVMSAPRRAPAIPAGSWAVFAPLYALRSATDWGIGSFTELGALDRWAGERGARMLGTLPLLAAFLDEPFEPSPYSPASRLFWNEAFIDVERAGRTDPPAAGAVRLPHDLDRLRGADAVELRAVAAAKRRALEPLAESFFAAGPPGAFHAFVRATSVRDYARFRAEVDRRRQPWAAWPATQRDGRLDGDAESDPAGRYHLYAQWLAHAQLADVGERAGAEGRGLILDLPLGVDGASYDVWRHRDAFATGSSAGAPPDLFFSGGQDWGFPPLHPERIREDGYAYPRAVVGHLLRYASALRVDHVMGLHRLYWIPRGVEPGHGAYVRYRADEWYALLSIEAHRAGAAIVGEDLGTVPGYVRRAMRRRRVHTSYVIQFEADPRTGRLHDPPPGSAASLGTHDLPPWAAFWSGGDVRLFRELGLLDEAGAAERVRERKRIRRAIVAGLRQRGLLEDVDADAGEVQEAALRFLARSDAALAVIALEDLWLEERPQNVPGTGAGRRNWRGRLRLALEELAGDDRVNAILDAVARDRARVAGGEEAA